MKIIALIPARYSASRFPGKMLAELSGKSVILRTYEAAVNTELFDEVIVVCDHHLIHKEITSHGGKAMMSSTTHETGTDRIAEAAEKMQADIIVNIQGDEPFTKKAPIEKLLSVFDGAEGKNIQVASLMQQLQHTDSISDPNYVKVVVDNHSNALFFSRSIIPFSRTADITNLYFEHIGVYAFRQQTLINFPCMLSGPLENAEKVECLRFLENGIKMKMVLTDYMGIEIDTPEDLEKAINLLNNIT